MSTKQLPFPFSALILLLVLFVSGCNQPYEPEEVIPTDNSQPVATLVSPVPTPSESAIQTEVPPISIAPEDAAFLVDTARLLHQATALAFSADSTRLAVGTLNDGVYVYPLSNINQPIHLPVEGIVRGLTFSMANEQIAVLSWRETSPPAEENAMLGIWEISTAAVINTINLDLSKISSSDPQELDLLPGILIAMESEPQGYLISDIHTSRMKPSAMLRLNSSLNKVYETDFPALSISSCPAMMDQETIVYSGRSYDLAAGSQQASFELFSNRIACMTGGTSQAAFSTAGDYAVRIGQVQENQISTIRNLNGASDEILSLAFNPTETLLAASTRNHQLLLWDVNTGSLLRVLNGTYHAVFSPDNTTLAVIHADMQLGAIAPWSVRIYQIPAIPENIQEPVDNQSMVTPEVTPTNTRLPQEATAVPTTVASYYACSDAMPSNLVSNMSASIAPNVLGVRIRTSPGIDQPLVTSFAPNDRVQIMDGPVCANGYVWWLIQRDIDQVQGWAAEGGDQVYWILPCTPEQCP